MITHIVAFRWKPETTAENIAAIAAGLATMPGLVDSIRSYEFGSDIGLSGAGNMDFALVATFDSADGWHAYDENPDHEALRTDVIRPWVAERMVIQFES